MLIGLTSNASRAGKSTVADYLIRKHGFMRLKVSTPFKEMLNVLFAHLGFDKDSRERMTEGDSKFIPFPELFGKAPVDLMMSLGQQWGRAMVGQYLWVNILNHNVERMQRFERHIVVDDIRQSNEREWLRSKGGVLVRVLREEGTVKMPMDGLLEKEAEDYCLHNSGSGGLHAKVDIMVEDLKKRGIQ